MSETRKAKETTTTKRRHSILQNIEKDVPESAKEFSSLLDYVIM